MTDPISPKYQKFMNDFALQFDAALNGGQADKEVGFFLVMYDFNKEPQAGRMNYISNSLRPDVVAMLKEITAQLEGRYHKGTESKQ